MKKYIVWLLLAALMVTGAVLEGLVEGLPQHWVQLNGFVTILSTFGFVAWTLKKTGDFEK